MNAPFDASSIITPEALTRGDGEGTVVPLAQRITRMWLSPQFSMVLVVIGWILQIVQFSFNRAFWLDESFLALNLRERGFMELLEPLSDDQGAPVGFLWLVKAVMRVFGDHDWSLRLVPLASGLLGLAVFAWLSRRVLPPWLAPFATTLLAFNGVIIYYASEFKQYEGDFAAAAVVYAMVYYFWEDRDPCVPQAAALGLIGAVLLWFSHGVLMVLAGVGISLGVRALYERNWHHVRLLAVVALVWGLSFAAVYMVSLRGLGNDESLHEYWNHFFAFAPMPLHSLDDVQWYFTALRNLFGNDQGPLAMRRVWMVALPLALLGLAWWARRFPARTSMLVLPILITLVLSMAHKYPFSTRLLLFTVPALVLFLAAGIDALYTVGYKRISRHWITFCAITCLVGVLLAPSVTFGLLKLQKPRCKENIRVPLEYLGEHLLPGDTLYIYLQTSFVAAYYREQYQLGRATIIEGTAYRNYDADRYREELRALAGHNRVWILQSQYSKGDDLNTGCLDDLGVRVAGVEGYLARVDLYDLSTPPASAAAAPSAPESLPQSLPDAQSLPVAPSTAP